MRLAALALALGTTGCASQLAGGAGGSLANDVRADHPFWSGAASGALMFGKSHVGTIGAELRGRHEYDYGTSWSAGLQGGWAFNPEPGTPVGVSVHADVGTPLRDGALFPSGSVYWGATGELLVWLAGERELDEINSSPWLLVRKPELVLFHQTRVHHDFGRPGLPDGTTVDMQGGIGLRLRLVTEYF
jgi:hypothetical protein